MWFSVIWRVITSVGIYHQNGLPQSWNICKKLTELSDGVAKIDTHYCWIYKFTPFRSITVNRLTGRIPSYLGNITSLVYLYFSCSYVSLLSTLLASTFIGSINLERKFFQELREQPFLWNCSSRAWKFG